MRMIAPLWLGFLWLGPPAMITMLIVGIWGDSRWAYTAIVMTPVWLFALGVTVSIVTAHKESKSSDLDIPEWMKNN